MPVSSLHPAFLKWRWLWQRCRDCVAGQDAVKEKREFYLHRLDGQNEYEYEDYKDRALFYGASDRTVKALTGAIMRRPPQINFPGYDEKEQELNNPSKPHLLSKIGARSEPIQLIIKKTVEEMLTCGRVGIYVDADTEGDPEADPYIAIYFAENIINWGERNVAGRHVLEFVVLKEENPIRETGADEDQFAYRTLERFRVLMLRDIGTIDQHLWVGLYEQRKVDDGGSTNESTTAETDAIPVSDTDQPQYDLIAEYEPRFKGGMPVPYIPFVFANPSNNTVEVEKPPILDLVNVNLSHYKNSADLEHGMHFTALPTAWIAGFSNESKMRIGSSVAWVSDEPTAKAGYLEFSGHGLGFIKSVMDKKEAQMAVLGARLLEEQKADSEAAAAIRLRHSGEESVLQHIVKSLDEAFTTALKWVAEWTRAKSTTVSVKLNDEFNPLGIDSQTMIIMLNMVQSGKMSYNTFYYNLQRGNMYPDGWSQADEMKAIAEGAPMPPASQLQEDIELKGGQSAKGVRITTPSAEGLGSDLSTP